MKPAWILYLFLHSIAFVRAQEHIWIEGRILNDATREPVQYANIYNKTLQKGSISDAGGYFRMAVGDVKDSVFIVFIGYETQIVALQSAEKFYTIYLKVSTQLLKEVVVTPKDNDYLLDAIMRCKRHSSSPGLKAKAYFQLKTFKDDAQMELLEGYYNIDALGYDVAGMTMKEGRLAMQPSEDRFFISLESSKAITRMKCWGENQYFPESPLSVSKQTLRKSYDLYLDKKYLDDATDSIYVINFDPVDSSGAYFTGQMWINKTKNTLVKLKLNCAHATVHPFLPLFDTDSISNVSFMITRTFAPQDDHIAFNHIDFNYVVDYQSRIGEANALSYSVRTEAIVYAYDFDDPFMVPLTNLADSTYSDYRKINAIPYNDFFWKYNDEYGMSDGNGANELFFSDTNSVTSRSLFKTRDYFKKGLFQQPYVLWSEDRVFFRPSALDTIDDPDDKTLTTEKYQLEVKYFMDINTYLDSTNISTAVILDPYESFYHLPLDNKTHCFINIFFDLCEIERRKLEAELKSVPNDESTYRAAYNGFVTRMDKLKYQYLKSVDRGTNQQELIKWNDIVSGQLGIDNIAIFKPYSEN